MARAFRVTKGGTGFQVTFPNGITFSVHIGSTAEMGSNKAEFAAWDQHGRDIELGFPSGGVCEMMEELCWARSHSTPLPPTPKRIVTKEIECCAECSHIAAIHVDGHTVHKCSQTGKPISDELSPIYPEQGCPLEAVGKEAVS
jgi:hypothetical protein